MLLRVEKNLVGDIAALTGLNAVAIIMLLCALGLINIAGPIWALKLGAVVCFAFSVPIFARMISSPPLVEINDGYVVFYVGIIRNRRVQIKRSSLLDISVDEASFFGEIHKILCLRFEPGALNIFKDYSVFPYLSIRSNLIIIQNHCIGGNVDKIAELWTKLVRSGEIGNT